jgi:hypothetical protein
MTKCSPFHEVIRNATRNDGPKSEQQVYACRTKSSLCLKFGANSSSTKILVTTNIQLVATGGHRNLCMDRSTRNPPSAESLRW